MKAFGQQIKELEYGDLPPRLQEIRPRINKLYYVGNKELLYTKAIAIVGTRNMTAYGKRMCTYFSKEICKRGITIISGLAKGIDCTAQCACIKNGGNTIGVMGTGFGELFPKENVGLMQEIIDNGGLIITEYDYSTKYNKTNFPMRNRIISGLSDGVLVVEAAIKSGSGITARYAFEQEKKVFAVPGRVGDVHSAGTNEMIKKGAHLVEKIEDIEREFPNYFEEIKEETTPVPERYVKIMEYLKESDYSIDELVEYHGLDYSNVSEVLISMELDGYVENIGGVYRSAIQ